MAMLAEPRRKQKVINLRAKNNAWSNDSTKFGQRMLERMGWTSGKGLGANENGITEHVVARYKNDEKGLGFEDKNDQWTKHEDDFNALLANLTNATDNSENLHSGKSLEDKSKKSKARIHYHKFTRGKDISRYSEKDLANIFGKKSFKTVEVASEVVKDDLKTTEQIFTEKGSMEDYFKNKLALFKSKATSIFSVNEKDEEHDEPDYGFSGFSQEKDETEYCNGFGYSQENNSNHDVNTNDIACDPQKLKKKKTKKIHADSDTCEVSNENLDNTIQNIDFTEQKIKKKKVKHTIEEENSQEDSNIHDEIKEKIKKKKSKKRKYIENDEDKEVCCQNGHETSIQNICDTDRTVKKKKTSKNGIDCSESIQINHFTVKETKQPQLYKNKKKKESNNLELCQEILDSNDVTKKKKSKRKHDQNIDVPQNIINSEQVPKKKKKRKSKEKELL